MAKQIKYIIVLLFLLIMVTTVTAVDILKPAQIDENYTILQTCATCSFVEITISNVGGIVESNKQMLDNGSGLWVYFFTPTTNSRYDVGGLGDLNGVNTSFVTFFEVTPSGKVSSTGDSILYALFSLILFGAIFLISFFIVAIPSHNEKDDKGFETKVIRLKYVRVLLIVLLYPVTILLLNFLNGLAVNFVALSLFAGILGFLFETLLRLTWAFTIIIIAWIVVMLIHDTNINKQLDRFEKFNPFDP